MSPTRNVAVLVGSLRKDSLNRKVAHALTALAPASLKLGGRRFDEVVLHTYFTDETTERAVPGGNGV